MWPCLQLREHKPNEANRHLTSKEVWCSVIVSTSGPMGTRSQRHRICNIDLQYLAYKLTLYSFNQCTLWYATTAAAEPSNKVWGHRVHRIFNV